MLLLKSLEDESIHLTIDRPRLTIGRDSTNDLVLMDEQVSGFHACIFFENDRVDIIDLGSTNGTWVMGKRIAGRTILQPWSKLRFGDTEFEVVDTEKRRPTRVQTAIDDALIRNANALNCPRSEHSEAQIPTAVLKAVSHGAFPRQCEVFGKLSIGRDASNSLVLDLPTVSTRHAEITADAHGMEVIDLGSVNGTYVNNRKVARQALQDGDRVRFDEIEYEVSLTRRLSAKTQVNMALRIDSGGTAVNPSIPLPDEFGYPANGGRQKTPDNPAFPLIDESMAASPKPSSPATTTSAPGHREDRSFTFSDPVSPGVNPAQVDTTVQPPPGLPPPTLPSDTNGLPQAKGISKYGLGWLLFSSEGRISRSKWFLAIMGTGIAGLLLSMLLQGLFYGYVTGDIQSRQYIFCSLTALLIMLWPNMALCIKRFHDQNRSGHWCWLIMVPVISIIPSIMLLFVSGTRGPNRYGNGPA